MLTLILLIFWRCLGINVKELENSGQITDSEVRLIDFDGTQLGIMKMQNAISIAEQKNLDLVQMNSESSPPVYKIMDYGKYKFELAKREKESKKKQKVVNTKEIRLSVNIDIHDLETKVGQARKFIESGDKIKVSIRFKGRENGHPEIGFNIMKKFAELCSDFAVVGKSAQLEGKNMSMFLNSKTVSKNKFKN